MQILPTMFICSWPWVTAFLCYNEPWCAQGSDTATVAETQAGDVPPVTPVVDPALLLDVEPVFAHNLAELLDGLGLFNS